MACDRELGLEVEGRGAVSALLRRPDDARFLLVLGHGAGAGMRHAFLEAASAALAAEGVATLRYQFPYAEAGRRRPDGRAVLLATVRAAAREARRRAEGLPLLAGGKSMGGRMTSLAAAESPLEDVGGLVFLGFPLHPAGRPADERAAHLERVDLPLLFLQGTRDRLADMRLVRTLCGRLGPRAVLHEVPEADHSFRVPKRARAGDAEVHAELARAVRRFADGLAAPALGR